MKKIGSKKIFVICFKFLKWFLISSICLTILYRFIPIAFTPLMFWRSISSISAGEKRIGIEKKWVSLDEISKSMQSSVVKAEDYKFYQHYGFDFEAIEKAIEYNKKHKKKKGASTISQQTAKNVFLWPSRSWVRKGLEVYFTVLIEIFWSKERILEVYLNVIELGKGVYGVEAAAQKFFNRSAKKINASQAALMAAVLPNPIKFRIDRPGAYILNRQRRIMGTKLVTAVVKENKDNIEEKSKEFFSLKFENEEELGKEEGQEEIKTEEVKTEGVQTPPEDVQI